MAKKSTVTQIPHFSYNYYDKNTGQWVYTDKLRHADYEGEVVWSRERLPDGRSTLVQPTMIDNDPFDALLIYNGYYRGRSAAGMRFRDVQDIPYTVFLTDFEKMVWIMDKGVVRGKFIYCKRGKNYGIKLYVP